MIYGFAKQKKPVAFISSEVEPFNKFLKGMIFTENKNEAEIDFSRRLIKTEDRAKSNTHRIDRLENLADEIHNQNENIAHLVEKLEAVSLSLNAHEKRLFEMEKLPRSRQNIIFTAVVTAIISSAVSALATLLIAVV